MPCVCLFPVWRLQVSRGSESFRVEKLSKVAIENVASHHYLRGLCSQRTLYASPNPGLSSWAASGNMTHDHMNNLNGRNHRWVFKFQKLPSEIHCCVSFSFCVFREDHHLLLQVEHRGQGFQRYASGPKHYRVQLLHQVLQERGEGAPASGGKHCWVSGEATDLRCLKLFHTHFIGMLKTCRWKKILPSLYVVHVSLSPMCPENSPNPISFTALFDSYSPNCLRQGYLSMCYHKLWC